MAPTYRIQSNVVVPRRVSSWIGQSSQSRHAADADNAVGTELWTTLPAWAMVLDVLSNESYFIAQETQLLGEC
jgi:hypothetical protein